MRIDRVTKCDLFKIITWTNVKSNKARYFINKPIGRDSLHCICRDLTVIAPCFDLFRGEQSGSMVKLW